MERRLAAILAADVVGYSRLIREDETSTLAALKAHREELIDPKITQYHGRIVKLMGDGLLAEFPSAVEAVQCAVEIQHTMAERNADVPEERRITYRVGINIGDIVVEDDDIFGDGVNIAARLEGLADPGGICISRPVHTQVADKLELQFEDMGEQQVKNIAKPVVVYRVALDAEAAALVTPVVQKIARPKHQRWLVAAAAATVLVLAVVGALWWQLWAPDVEPASVERMAFPLPDEPSIAVLPFDNLSGDSEQEPLSDGITEDIITELSRFRELFVIARHSTQTYKGKPVKVQEVAEDLGVRYVLEGSVRKTGDKVRINAQLIDATSGRHLWAERYDRALSDIFAIQDEIVGTIVTSLAVKVHEAERARTRRKPTESLEAYDYFLRGRDLQLKEGFWRIGVNQQARGLYEKAAALDPEFTRAFVELAWTHLYDFIHGWSATPEQSRARALELAQQAVAMDAANARAHYVLGYVQLYRQEFDRAIAEIEKAINLNPNDARFRAGMAGLLIYAGKPLSAIDKMHEAMRLNPHHESWYVDFLAWAYFHAERYDEALATLEQIAEPDAGSNRTYAAIYARMDRMEEARAHAATARELDPDFSVSHFSRSLPYAERADLDFYLDALRLAGLPENPPLELPDKPSIAVLPFNNLSDDPEQEYFADGMAEDLITDLSKISGLFVIARNSSFSYKGQQVKVRQVAEELGVRYVLEGSVRRAGDEVRINVQLIDATTGGHLWAERYDGTLEDVFDLQDNVTKRIVDALALELTPEETRTVGDIGTENIAAHDAYLLGLSYYHRRTPEDNATARTHFETAILLDPDYSTAYTALAKVYAQAAIGGPSYSEKLRIDNFQGYVKVWQLLDQGMSEPNADYYVLRSWLALRKHLHDRAIAEAEKALELNPNDAEAMEALADALIYAGQPKAGIEFAEKAIRQNPTSLGRALYLMATAEFALGDSAKALEYLDRAIQKAPNEKYFTGLLTAVHGDLGHVEQAKAAFNVFDEYEQYEHGIIRLAGMVALYPFSDPDVLERLANGFKAGGVSVGIGGYLPLHSENQLSGQEIKSLLFGKEIKGHWFWFKGGEDGSYWRQPRTVDGGVRHFGFQIHQYLRSGASGVGRIENDMLCERWGNLAPELEICVVIFRVTDPLARARWGDYVMVTEAGPQPFNVVE